MRRVRADARPARRTSGSSRYGRQPGAATRAAAAAGAACGARASRSASRAFWLLAGTFFVCGASTNGLIGTHLIPACHDYGITEVRAGGPAGDDGHLRHHRHDRLRLAHRSRIRAATCCSPTTCCAASSLLFLPATLQSGRSSARLVRGVLRAGLGGHRAADRAPDERGLRPREHRRHLRLDRRQPSARRLAGRVRRRRHSHDAGRLSPGLLDRRRSVPDGRRGVRDGRPARVRRAAPARWRRSRATGRRATPCRRLVGRL